MSIIISATSDSDDMEAYLGAAFVLIIFTVYGFYFLKEGRKENTENFTLFAPITVSIIFLVLYSAVGLDLLNSELMIANKLYSIPFKLSMIFLPILVFLFLNKFRKFAAWCLSLSVLITWFIIIGVVLFSIIKWVLA